VSEAVKPWVSVACCATHCISSGRELKPQPAAASAVSGGRVASRGASQARRSALTWRLCIVFRLSRSWPVLLSESALNFLCLL